MVSLLLALCVPSSALGKDFYVDPATGLPSGDGSATKPWRTIGEVITANLVQTQSWASLPYTSSSTLVAKNPAAPIKAGDTIYLRSGYHGELSIIGHYNSGVITIAAQAGHSPKLNKVLVRSSSNWVLRGLHVSPEFDSTYSNATMIVVENHSWTGPIEKITVEDCQLRSVSNAAAWTAADWDTKSANGFQVGGKQITLRGNTLKNVNFGISVTATSSLVEKNIVENFAGDGLRGLGDYTVFQYNTVKNCYDVNANHDDGFQSWSVGTDGKVGTGAVTGVVLRGNTIINYEDPSQPHRGTLQGIGLFDGMFVDWVIENNVIITDHWHGITLLGAKNCRVVNNTVIDPNTTTPGPPWIQIGAHKDGTLPSGCVVRNNLATSFNSAASGVTEDHNIKITSLATFFVNAAAYDLHLKAGCTAIDQGSALLAPVLDIEGTPRPQGLAVDIGAYEWIKPGTKLDAGPKLDKGAALDRGASTGDLGGPSESGGPRELGTADVAAPLETRVSLEASAPVEGGAAGRPSSDCSCGVRSTPTTVGPLVVGLLLILAGLRGRQRR